MVRESRAPSQRPAWPSWKSAEQRSDFLMGGALLVLAVFEFIVFRDLYAEQSILPTGQPNGWLLLLTIIGVTPVAFRRRWPVVTMIIAHLAWVAAITLEFAPTSTGQFAIFITFYSVGVYGRHEHADRARAITLALVLMWMVLGVVVSQVPWGLVPIVAAVYAVAWSLGSTARNRYETQVLLQERAERAEGDRVREAEAAVEEERARIARELHDVVAHSLTVMTVQAAGAKRVIDSDVSRATAALDTIEATGREAMGEMRRVIQVMRDGSDRRDRLPQPGIGAIPQLVGQIEDAGLSVACDIDDPPTHLPPGVDLTAYRIVQEALTNTMKHGGPGVRANVTIAHDDGALDLRISDNGRGSAAEPNQSGLGLVGMRERVGIYGGAFKAAPQPGGGFTVHARIPTGTST